MVYKDRTTRVLSTCAVTEEITIPATRGSSLQISGAEIVGALLGESSAHPEASILGSLIGKCLEAEMFGSSQYIAIREFQCPRQVLLKRNI